MVTLNAVELFFVVVLSIYFATTGNTQQINLNETLFNRTQGIYPQKYSKARIYNQGTNHSYAPASLFTCICIAPYDFNVSSPVLDSDNHVNDKEPRNSSYKFKILLCPTRNVYCSIWKPYKEPSTSNICNYEVDKLKSNVKEARNRKKSCTRLLKDKGMGHHETIANKNKSEKIDFISPIIKANQAKAVFLLYRNSTLSIKKLPNVLQVGTTTASTSFQRGDEITLVAKYHWSTWVKRARRSTILSLKPMIFPHLNRNLMDRKRNGNKEMNATAKFSDGMLMTNLTDTNGDMILNNDTNHYHHKRDKRETQILYAKYSKTKKSSRKRRPKPTSSSSTSCDDDKFDNVSSSPYTFLNVSFTGYWEPPERTTVKPRVRKPLKMTDQDRNFVYGDDDQKNEKSDRRNQGKSSGSGWTSKIKINFRS